MPTGLQITPDTPASPDACMLLEALSTTLQGITGSSGKASFDANEMLEPRACFAVARSPSGEALGCGAIRPLDATTAELKRMYAAPGTHGVGAALLGWLEDEARRLGYAAIHLETRKANQHAMAFYARNGYAPIANYGRYIGHDEAVCFGKQLKPLE